MRLEIQVNDKKVEKIVSDYNKIIKNIGNDMTRQFKKRIDQLKAAENFKEYLDTGLGDPHPLIGNLDRMFGIRLNRNYRLIVEPISVFLDDESLKKCDQVNLKGVVDYHDGKCEWIIP